jgi:hypothetical protein
MPEDQDRLGKQQKLGIEIRDSLMEFWTQQGALIEQQP